VNRTRRVLLEMKNAKVFVGKIEGEHVVSPCIGVRNFEMGVKLILSKDRNDLSQYRVQ
jgi:hypothetical protein